MTRKVTACDNDTGYDNTLHITGHCCVAAA